MHHHGEFHQNQLEGRGDIAIFRFLRRRLSAIFDFEHIKFLLASQVRRANMHHNTIFHQNRSQDCQVIVFNGQNGGCLSILNLLNLNFGTAAEVQMANMCCHTKFSQNQ